MSAKEAKSHHTTDPPPPVVVVLDSHEDADDYDCDDDDDHPSPPKKKRAKNSTKTTTINANDDGSDGGKDAHTKAGRRRRRGGGGDKSFRPESDALLDDMLHPLTVDDFLGEHFRHNAVHIDRRNLPRKMREGLVRIIRERYLFDLNVRKIFEETSSENVFLWLRPPSPSTSSSSSSMSSFPPTPPPLDSVEISDPEIAHKLHVSGSHPAYCRAPPSLERLLVSSLLRSTGLGGGHYHPPHNDNGVAPTLGGGTTLGRGEVELFVGTTTSSSNATPTTPTPATSSSSRSRGGGNKKTINGDGGGGKSGSSSSSRVVVAGGGCTTGWHTDFQENFTIQLTGIKRWTLRRGRVRHPLRGTTPHFARMDGVVENQLKAARICRPSGGGGGDDSTSTSTSHHFEGGYGFEYSENNAHGPEFAITMRPGDVLYFPAGMWHKVETLEYGVSMNVSLMGTTYATLVCEALQHLLVGGADGDAWREVVMTSRPPATTTGGGGGADGGGTTNATTMTGRLGGLLAGLGRLVDDFVTNGGGARSLLPPALCHPPFPPPGHEDDDDDDGDGGPSSEEEGRDGSGGSSSDGRGSEVGDDDDDDDDGDDSGEEGPSSSSYGIVISMDDFVGPPYWDSSRPPNSKRFVRNPLATLMAMSDIAGHDDHPRRQQQQEQQRHGILNGDCNNGDEERHHLRAVTRQYVLNVNFAGNEMMESHVRVILETSESNTVDRMEHYLACEQRGMDPGRLPSDPEYAGGSSADDFVPQMCLFYYGYFVWI